MRRSSEITGLSHEELQSLNDNGYVGPFGGVLPDEQVDVIAKTMSRHSRDRGDRHPLYGRYSVRDWHLVYPALVDFVSHPSVVAQLKSIMGEDLLLWRSNMFYKPPKTGPIGWHQEFGTFSGEDIGNNKPSLVPTHLDAVDEDVLRQYLPTALGLTGPEVAPDLSPFWDITVWVALSDVDADMGVLRFLPGSHRTRYPVRMVPLPDSDFWQDPFENFHDKAQLFRACRDSQLVLDVETSHLLDDVSVDDLSYAQLKEFVLRKLGEVEGSLTVCTDRDEDQMVTLPTRRGEYVIFSERVLHGSLANRSERERLAISFRITPSSTLVFPSRMRGDFLDGFNLDVSRHESILLSGRSLNPLNATRSLDPKPSE